MGRRLSLISFMIFYLALCACGAESKRRVLGWKILVVEGQGAINFKRKALERKFVVRVQEEFGAPGKGLPVTFTAPEEGPGGAFKHYGRRAVVFTDGDGYAVLRGFRPNKIAGTYSIRVEAPVRGSTVATLIEQTNAESSPSAWQKFLHVFLKHRNSGDTRSASR